MSAPRRPPLGGVLSAAGRSRPRQKEVPLGNWDLALRHGSAAGAGGREQPLAGGDELCVPVLCCFLRGSCLSLAAACGFLGGWWERAKFVFSSFLAFSPLNVSVSRVAMLAGDRFVSAVKAVLLMFGAPER